MLDGSPDDVSWEDTPMKSAQWIVAGGVLASGQFCLASSLFLVPTFGPSITGDVNAAAIEATINTAIAVYEATFSDPITVNILFQEGGGLGSSSTAIGSLPYVAFRTALVADAKTSDDSTALAHLPLTLPAVLDPSGTGNLWVTTANLRALGLPGTPGGTACGGVGCDGTITLNTSLTTPGSPGTTAQFDLQAVVEHEIDEVLGMGSGLNLPSNFPRLARPQDLFRYDNSGGRSFNTSGSVSSFFSIDGTTLLVQFNQDGTADYGDWKTGAAPPQVQDAFATVGAHPVLGVELRNLDVIGYDSAIPEPASAMLIGAGLVVLGLIGRRINPPSVHSSDIA